MSKSIHFSGQPIFNQLLVFLDKSKIKKIAKQNSAEHYVKKFSTYNHVVVMLFVAIKNYTSIREAILGLLADSHKLAHLGLNYLVRRSTLSEANQRRSSKVFGYIYGCLSTISINFSGQPVGQFGYETSLHHGFNHNKPI
jgi:hypothetical protein